MFGSRSGSPYPGATGLLNSGNASAGPGGPLSAAGNVPPPSGGMPQSSVYNQSLDNEPNVVPSQFMFPSSHPELKGDQNKIREGDLLFVLRDLNASFASEADGAYADGFRTRQPRLSKDEVPLVTIQKLNELLREAAVRACEHQRDMPPVTLSAYELEDIKEHCLFLDAQHWWQDPELVAQWAVPFGAALNSVQLNRYGGGGDPNNRANREDWQAHNVVVSRKANLKNNFYSIKARKGEKWHSQSMQRVGVQYSLEMINVGDRPLNEKGSQVHCVQVTCLLLDDPNLIKGQRMLSSYNALFPAGMPHTARRVVKESTDELDSENRFSVLATSNPQIHGTPTEHITFDSSRPLRPRVEEDGYHLFEQRPLGDPAARVIVQIGRVLHSAPRQPSAYECLTSCFNKSLYDSLKPIEIELGCP